MLQRLPCVLQRTGALRRCASATANPPTMDSSPKARRPIPIVRALPAPASAMPSAPAVNDAVRPGAKPLQTSPVAVRSDVDGAGLVLRAVPRDDSRADADRAGADRAGAAAVAGAGAALNVGAAAAGAALKNRWPVAVALDGAADRDEVLRGAVLRCAVLRCAALREGCVCAVPRVLRETPGSLKLGDDAVLCAGAGAGAAAGCWAAAGGVLDAGAGAAAGAATRNDAGAEPPVGLLALIT